MTDESRSSYRQIIKATSIFGGVQVYQVVLSLVRSKVVAVLLGAQGMGITGLLLSATSLVTGATNLGLGVSAVRNVAEANGAGDAGRVALVAGVVKKLAWATGTLGSLLMLVLAPWLSRLTFGNEDFTIAFRVLSVTMLLASVSSAQYVLLQGMRRLRELAKANAVGATLGLLVSVPLYYYYGMAGIVPALVVTAISTLALAFYYGAKVQYNPIQVPWSKVWSEGRGMIKMGILLSLGGLIGIAVGYITRIFITQTGSLVDVGLYSAGFAIVNTYVGMIFTAMGTDYYPRLSAVASDHSKMSRLMNQQAEMAMLILGPILLLFLIFLEYAIIILYSNDFLAMVPMVQWFVLAIFLKALVWSIGFVFLAKRNSKIFFYNELIVNSYTLAISVIGYYYYGLEGLGISFLIAYVLAAIQNIVILTRKFKVILENKLLRILGTYLVVGLFCLFLLRKENGPLITLSTFSCFALIAGYSLMEINKRIGIRSLLKKL